MPSREQVFLEILDPKGTAFYKCGQRKYEKLLPALSTVHSTRLARKGKRTFQLKHGPQDLGCESYAEVLQLFRLLGKGITFADALGRATGMRPGNYISSKKGGELVSRLKQNYHEAVDGPAWPIKPYESTVHERVRKHSNEKKTVNSTPLPRELSPQERRAIWQPPFIRK